MCAHCGLQLYFPSSFILLLLIAIYHTLKSLISTPHHACDLISIMMIIGRWGLELGEDDVKFLCSMSTPSLAIQPHAMPLDMFLFFYFFIWLRLDLYFFRSTKSVFALFYKIKFWKEIYVILQFGLFLVVGCGDSS